MKSREWAYDSVVGALVFAATAWWGVHYLGAAWTIDRRPGVTPEIAEPAALAACGYGAHFAESPPPPALARFVANEDLRFSCDTLRSAKISSRPLVSGAWLYLLLMTAAAWKIFGVAWASLIPLCGALLGAASVAVYAILRFAMGRLLAVAGALAAAISTLPLLVLPNIRDYAKAPFMLALVAMALLIGLRRLTPRGLVALCACFGAVTAVGYGIRMDVIVQLPLLVLTVLFFVPAGPASRLRVKVAGLAAAAVAFALVATPLFRASAETGSNLWHFALIGFMPDYGTALGVENDTYHYGVAGTDEFIQLVVADSVHRLHPDQPRPILYTREYEIASRSYYFQIARRFPADMLTRALASISRMPEVAFGWPMAPLANFATALYAAREWLFPRLYGYGILATAAALIGLALVRPRDALFMTTVMAYLGTYPAVQFNHRHFFYLEVITWMSLGFVVSQLCRIVRTRRAFPTEVPTRVIAGRALGTVAIACMLGGVLAGVRLYQAARVRQTIAGYLRSPDTLLALDRRTHDGVHIVTMPAFTADNARLDWARLIRVDLNADACGGARVTFRYDRTSPYRILTTSTVIPASEGTGSNRFVLFEPVYAGFSAVEFEDARGECFRSISNVTGLENDPVWLPLRLDPLWRNAALYQALRTRENIH